jgi:hypothetical protein
VEDDLLVAGGLEDSYHQVPCISGA